MHLRARQGGPTDLLGFSETGDQVSVEGEAHRWHGDVLAHEAQSLPLRLQPLCACLSLRELRAIHLEALARAETPKRKTLSLPAFGGPCFCGAPGNSIGGTHSMLAAAVVVTPPWVVLSWAQSLSPADSFHDVAGHPDLPFWGE